MPWQTQYATHLFSLSNSIQVTRIDRYLVCIVRLGANLHTTLMFGTQHVWRNSWKHLPTSGKNWSLSTDRSLARTDHNEQCGVF